MGWLRYLFAVGLPMVCFATLAYAQIDPASNASNRRDVLVVIGAPGESEYAALFREWGERWRNALSSSCRVELIDGTVKAAIGDKADRERIIDWIAKPEPPEERWVVLIGHGTSDRDATKFNLRGPDIGADELAKELSARKTRWVIINCASSSGPFIAALSGKNRVVVTATKSGSEQNYARFGEYISQAISDRSADLDHDNSVSILESFLAASNRVAQFYANEDRLASEQALLDDNGDKKGTPAAFYRGARPVKAPADGLQVDGLFASRIIVSAFEQTAPWTADQQKEIEALETQIEELRVRKREMSEDDYYTELEKLFFKIIAARK